MENEYLIAANTKRGQLIFNVFRPIDLGIALTGTFITFILLMIIGPKSLLTAILVLLPFLICAFLVVPVPNYHNVLCFLQNLYRYYVTDAEQNELIWRGWCVKDEYGEK